jgi:hypothetical protein
LKEFTRGIIESFIFKITLSGIIDFSDVRDPITIYADLAGFILRPLEAHQMLIEARSLLIKETSL